MGWLDVPWVLLAEPAGQYTLHLIRNLDVRFPNRAELALRVSIVATMIILLIISSKVDIEKEE